jgi:hypothetical protein
MNTVAGIYSNFGHNIVHIKMAKAVQKVRQDSN